MIHYTIGIYFNHELSNVVLLLKNRPKWQAGLYNFPGGKMEEGEDPVTCIVREFNEECGVLTRPIDWNIIGTMSNGTQYCVNILACKRPDYHEDIKTGEDQEAFWALVNNLPGNIITNLTWLIPIARCFFEKGNNTDYVSVVTIECEYPFEQY